ncbi:oligosaccharide flippase family protein [Paracraurococcus lichenis]|uniref:Oligosaccharide flippase family protein n=1 Tax=Paracraurococcus lichenis TaxID=3064888 RepID=A0ABT9E118_9PROT|nr:oligosaccharide flippase family protein [Paracraurococcus sp. LOR1-02]MDO9709710.1 oligosaccharide flippase family protein [Paracraurococcus sp. LOR1-02]
MQASGTTAGMAAEGRASRGLVSRTLWSALDFWLQQATALLVFIVVGNLVGPAAVGVLTVAQLGVTLAMTLLLDGFSDALIQRQRLEPAHFNTAFALLAGIGLASGLALWLLAPVAASVFGQPDLAWIMPLLAIGLPLLGMAVPCQALLQRQMRFGALAFRSLVAQGVGFATALALALDGHGVEALIAYMLVVRGLDTVLLMLLAGRLPGLDFSRQALADIVDFGKHRMGNQVLGFVVTQIDRVTAGLFLGAVTIGLFSLAERIANALTGGLSGVVERVGFSAFSARQSEPEALRQALRDVMFLANVLAMPAFVGLAAVSGDVVGALFSASWAGAAPVLALLALAGIPHATNYVLTAALNARGRPDLALRYSVVIMALRLVASLVAAPQGIVALAAANLAVTAASTGIVLAVVRHHLPGAAGLAARAALRPALAAGGMVLAIEGLALLLPPIAPALLLAGKVAIGAAAYAGLLLLLAPQALRRLARGSI